MTIQIKTYKDGVFFELPKDHVFVFGSNQAGRHGKGAAKTALRFFGAKYGKGEGLMRSKDNTRMSYAIPTKDHRLRILPLDVIKEGIDRFIETTRHLKYLTFYITTVGTGYAGYSHEEIAPLFYGIGENCVINELWLDFLQ